MLVAYGCGGPLKATLATMLLAVVLLRNRIPYPGDVAYPPGPVAA